MLLFFFLSCRALIGASIFISTVVLGTIIILVKVRSDHIGKAERERERETKREGERDGEGEREREKERAERENFLFCYRQD